MGPSQVGGGRVRGRRGWGQGEWAWDTKPETHLEDVAQGHGAVGEAVDEERLQKALDIVE